MRTVVPILLLACLPSLSACTTLQDRYHRLKPGMTASEVIATVGRPSRMDSTNTAWAYWPDPGAPRTPGEPQLPHFVLQMSPEPNQVLVKIGSFRE